MIIIDRDYISGQKVTVKTNLNHVVCLLGRNSIYQRYSTTDWDTSNRNNFMEAEKQRGLAERVRADLFRTVKVTDQMTRTRQQCNTRKLGIDSMLL